MVDLSRGSLVVKAMMTYTAMQREAGLLGNLDNDENPNRTSTTEKKKEELEKKEKRS